MSSPQPCPSEWRPKAPASPWRQALARAMDRLPLGAHGRLLALGTTQSLVALAAFRLALFLRLLAKTRLLSPSDMGRLTLATSITLVAFVATEGFPHALLRFASVLRGEAEAASDEGGGRASVKGLAILTYRIAVPFLLALSVLACVVAGPVGVGVFGDPRLVPLLRVIAAGSVLYTVTRLNVALVGSRYKVVYEHGAAAAEVLAMLGIVLLFSYVPERLAVFGTAFLAGNALVTIASFIVLRREMPFLFDRAFPAAPCHSPVTRFALLSALTAVARRMTEEMNVAVIAFFLQPDKIALYNVAGQIGILPCEFLRALNTILGPLAGNLYGKREIAAVRRLHFRTGALLAAAAAAGVAAYLVLGRPLLSLFGAYYRQAFAPMLIVAASTIVTSATGSAEIILNMGGRPHWNTANQVVLVALLAALSWMLVPRYGVTGAAAAYSLSQVARAILAMAEVCWTYRVDARSAAASGRQAEPPSGAASDR